MVKLENAINYVPLSLQPLPIPFSIIIAVNETECWFLSECNHFGCIDIRLTEEFISNKVGFNPFTDDMTQHPHPSEALKDIYQKVGKTYKKI